MNSRNSENIGTSVSEADLLNVSRATIPVLEYSPDTAYLADRVVFDVSDIGAFLQERFRWSDDQASSYMLRFMSPNERWVYLGASDHSYGGTDRNYIDDRDPSRPLRYDYLINLALTPEDVTPDGIWWLNGKLRHEIAHLTHLATGKFGNERLYFPHLSRRKRLLNFPLLKFAQFGGYLGVDPRGTLHLLDRAERYCDRFMNDYDDFNPIRVSTA